MSKLGCHLRVRNPWSMGYYSYLACVDAWRKVADRTVVVDGCSTDDSVARLLEWIGADPSVEVLANEASHWGERFRIEQSLVNKQLGHEALDECDWIVGLDADHIVDPATARGLAGELDARFGDELLVAFDVHYFFDGKLHKRKQPRPWIINNRLAKARGLRVGWGMDRATGPTDVPVLIRAEETFADPETGVEKRVCVGDALYEAPLCPIAVYRLGHFFFDEAQVLYKVRRWDAAAAEFFGRARKSALEARLDADLVGIARFMGREEVLRLALPPEAARAVEAFYREGMLGGALYGRHAQAQTRLLRALARLAKAARSALRA